MLKRLLLVPLALCAACTSDGTGPGSQSLDHTPPIVHVSSPTLSVYGSNADSLVELRVEWSDSGSGVDLGGVKVRSLRGVNGQGGSDAEDLLQRWMIERMDPVGLVAHETDASLLPGGADTLVLSVPDSSGNVLLDTVAFVLPVASYVKTIVSGLSGSGFYYPIGLALCDDDIVYIPADVFLIEVSAETRQLLATVPVDPHFGIRVQEMNYAMCTPGDPMLYVGATGVGRYDRRARIWRPVIGYFGTTGVTQSRADPDLLYLGWWDNVVGLAHKSTGTQDGFLLPIGDMRSFVEQIRALPGDSKLYAAMSDSGIWVVDPQRNMVVNRIVLGTSYSGSVSDLALSGDDSRLYAAVYGGNRGVAEIDTRTDQVTRTMSLGGFAAIGLALSPDGRRMFVTTQDNQGTAQSSNALIDISSWQVLRYFPRPRPPGVWRFDRGVAFRSDGKYIFVGHNWDVDVYLNRP